MRRAAKLLLPALVLGLGLAQAGCDSGLHEWVPPEDHNVKIVSAAAFVRTSQGEYVDGYLAEYEDQFRKQRMFMALEIQPYLEGDRLIVTGRFTGDTVRLPPGDRSRDEIPVFEVEQAKPNVPKAPDIPPRK